MPIDLTNPLIANGVTAFRHNIEAVNATQNAQVAYSDSTHYGPTGSAAANQAHPMKTSIVLRPVAEKLMCGGCHDFVNPNGVRLDSTFSTWYSSEYNEVQDMEQHRTCQDCHMPTHQGRVADDGPSRTVHSHYFVGVYQALLPGFPGRPEMARLAQNFWPIAPRSTSHTTALALTMMRSLWYRFETLITAIACRRARPPTPKLGTFRGV